MNLLKIILGLSILLLILTASVQAETVVLTPEKDAYIHGVNYGRYWRWWWQSGSGDTLKVGRWYTPFYELEDRILIHFDLSSIPSNANIASAELRLYYAGGTNDQGDQYQVCRLTENWNEYTMDRSWTYSRSRPSHVCSGITSTVPSAGWMTWDVTDDVKGFLSGSYTNYGWTIKFYTSDGWSYFNSRESTNKPQLVITYSTPTQQPTAIPEFTPIGLLVVVGLVVLAVRRISR